MTAAADFTVDEIMSTCIARRLTDDDFAGQGIATPLVVAGFLLAKLTHAPKLQFASAIGQAVVEGWAPLGLIHVEELWLGKAVVSFGFSRIVAELMPRRPPIEYFRPAQIDAQGNFNNIAIGSDYKNPRARLPGAGGIPDLTPHSDSVYIYVPRHSKVTFVEKVDFVSGLGHVPERRAGSGPVYCITDLGQFDWANGRMRLISYHPSVSIEFIQRKTGFELEIAPDVAETPPPTEEEVRLLRETIDPLSIRKLETLRAQPRKTLLREIVAREAEMNVTTPD